MTWNHRVLKRTVGDETFYEIVEVYYDKDGSVNGWTTPYLYSETPDQLRGILKQMESAIDKPVIDEATRAEIVK